ncbi:AAA family ATPase [uncultured Clostridium sp.]|uniref:AAA family ATPase n=1 Tax=uncultured Clostridium sp. TaxID=59620 RepID=UPI0025F77A5A|nr:AAA family ATPase [uncultured Clostridium sp.]
MIIKSVNINSFGGIKNKKINFSKGLNIVYGENEAGKSTIQSFIKIWLYGFSSYKGKDYKLNERIKYTPNDGDNISGELNVIHEDKEYIIRRTFGRTKKEDTSIIINSITGEEVQYINKEEPGKYFFNINRSTFINTVFIGQLGVSVKKDKEEEILDKLSNSIGSEEGQVSVEVAFSKLYKYKKSISNIRKSGSLDVLKNKYGDLLSERYEAYKLSNHNIENEENLIKLNEEKLNINKEISNLEIYKKYLKKIKIKKEYQEITEYFKKKEKLRNEQFSINKDLTFNDEVINNIFIENVKEDYSMYLNLLDIVNDEEERICVKEERLIELKVPLREYYYINNLPKDILSKLEGLKIKNEMLTEKYQINESIKNEIEFLNLKKKEAENLIGSAIEIKNFKEDLESLLLIYEEELKKLKSIMEEESDKPQNNIFLISLVVIFFISIILGIIIDNSNFKVLLYTISLGILIFIGFNFYINKKGSNKEKTSFLLKGNIEKIEIKLNEYCSKLQVNNYSELVNKLSIYKNYLELEEKINRKINEKLSQRSILDLDSAMDERENIKEEINNYLRIASVDSIDKLIKEIYKYKEDFKEVNNLEIELNNLKSSLNRTKEQLLIREEKLKRNLESIGFKNINISEIDEIIKEIEEKIKKRDEVSKSLASVEEAYSALTKGKDINKIKEELGDVININFNYSYENEDEIDEVIKEKNIRLVDVEKKLKDIENEIKNRFIGKRTIPVVEEEIKEVESNIEKYETQLKASYVVSEVLTEVYDEIRSSFGPILNSNVITSFKEFTDGKYNEVMVSDNYEMKVKDDKSIMAAEALSNGANDQLYLSLRLAFVEMIFKNKDIPICLDDTFIQYDDKRLERTIKYLIKEGFEQYIIFTCQKREEVVIRNNSISHKYIKL